MLIVFGNCHYNNVNNSLSANLQILFVKELSAAYQPKPAFQTINWLKIKLINTFVSIQKKLK
jgi:hypothetical protein